MKKPYLVSILVALVSTATVIGLASCESDNHARVSKDGAEAPEASISHNQRLLRSPSSPGDQFSVLQSINPAQNSWSEGRVNIGGLLPSDPRAQFGLSSETGPSLSYRRASTSHSPGAALMSKGPRARYSEQSGGANQGQIDNTGAVTTGKSPVLFTSHRWTREGLVGLDNGGQLISLPAELAAPVAAPTGQMSFRSTSPTDEVWIIAQPETPMAVNPSDDEPGTGSLMTMLPGTTTQVAVPLKHTEVTGSVAGFIASVNVQQRFENPYDGKIEAVYVFPLPDNAAVNGFLMTVGDRTIRGIIRKRAEAEQIYAQARAQGYTASLLTQERPNIFTQKVANIEPGKRIDIDITYFNTLSYSDGWFEFAFPMVVGPRFNPSSVAAAGTGIGAAERGKPGSTAQATEIQYLRPNERSGHDIGLTLSIEAGMPIESVESVSHEIEIEEGSLSAIKVSLKDGDTIPNRDFVLRYKVAGDEVRSGLVVQPDADGEGGYFAAMLVPPTDLERLGRSPLEMVFVLDCSGSMRGTPLNQAKEAVRTALDRLQPGDSFQIIRFSENATSLGSEPLVATPANIQRGKAYLDSINSGGGTQMIEGIRAALGFAHDPERLRYVAFLTDGFIGNESEILAEIESGLGDSRIFSFGVGTSTNRHLMEQMASFGRGVVAYLNPGDESRPVMSLFMDRIEHAALTDVRLELPGAMASEMYPARMPDLYVGRPIVTLGRYEGTLDESDWGKNGGAKMLGRTGGLTAQVELGEPRFVDQDAGLDTVWARTKIASLNRGAITAGAASEREEYTQMVESLALNHNLMSAFTSFVAVDSTRVTEGSTGTSVGVPVPVPVGVAYETTVGSPGG
ncbi:MAG: Ca-activated chloride channel family protein [Phycisphaerales bacterium]|jgi:Ca-activated chloride channel family protein